MTYEESDLLLEKYQEALAEMDEAKAILDYAKTEAQVAWKAWQKSLVDA